jgi:hypothetical protein
MNTETDYKTCEYPRCEHYVTDAVADPDYCELHRDDPTRWSINDELHEALLDIMHPDFDGAPWCQYCGASRERDCHCGPIAENN